MQSRTSLLGDSERLRQRSDHDRLLRHELRSPGQIARFRVNIYRQSGHTGIVMRKLQSQVPTFESLGLPPIFNKMVTEKFGIIFVTGSTGSGKTTTLAAMLNEINRTQRGPRCHSGGPDRVCPPASEGGL